MAMMRELKNTRLHNPMLEPSVAEQFSLIIHPAITNHALLLSNTAVSR
jgi:hypothetical protein